MQKLWLSRDEVRSVDKRAIQEFNVPGVVLMENAGLGATDVLMAINPESKPVLILCGPGNNGGDGWVMARHLELRGLKARTLLVADIAPSTGDAGINFAIAQSALLVDGQVTTSNLDEMIRMVRAHDGWIVDALFGTGLSRPLEGIAAQVVEAINESPSTVLAIDIPSGLDCDSGAPMGATVQADHTVTFVAFKKGFLRPESTTWTGVVHVVDIGAPKRLLDEYRALRST